MKVGHKRGRCHGCKYSFGKCKIKTKINTHITTQIESLNSLVFLITKGIIPVFTQWLLECFKCIYENSELISKHYNAGQCVQNVNFF